MNKPMPMQYQKLSGNETIDTIDLGYNRIVSFPDARSAEETGHNTNLYDTEVK